MPDEAEGAEDSVVLDVKDLRTQYQLLGGTRQRVVGAIAISSGPLPRCATGSAVMYAGRIVEQADVRTIFDRPLHEYTKALISSVPDIDDRVGRLPQIRGQPPMLHDLPPGDAFAPRSNLSFTAEDALIRPELVEVEPGHQVQLGRFSVADFERYAHLLDHG